ncbi:MAG: type II toxin-antitoxin system HipA family toxin [Prevotellaceae bacterium]|nr:type II toxin-antitoxin system HipA family toxin [Prevotellaceae bacterium]
MNTLYVYGDFDWLNEPRLIGELGYEYLSGSDSYSFKFDKNWLGKYGGIVISADINSYPGQQYTHPEKDIFGCFSDALPDRWGRTLLNRREQIEATEEKRPIKRLSSFDYLTGIDDFSRMGGFRFKETPDGEFINCGNNLRIPPVADIRTLVLASMEIEHNEERNLLPEKRWIQQLIHPGTSLGGARPKASVVDEQGQLCVAKFPSRKDDYDVAMWEHHSHLLAKECGVMAAETRTVSSGEKYHVLLSKRFDRTVEGRRVHFASAMTMTGLTDGCDAKSGNGYIDIVDFILQNCCDVNNNLRQLFRRVAFNIAIGNSDDHFRNHGFLLTPRGWTLAPAYDMNPTFSEYQSLLINSSTNESSLQILLESCGEYMIGMDDARQIIAEVVSGVSKWKSVAISLGIAKREIDMFEQVYCRN